MHIISLYNHFVGSAHATTERGLSILLLAKIILKNTKNGRDFFLQISHIFDRILLLCYLLRRPKMPASKFEANPTLRILEDVLFFALFALASLCSNDYFRTYATIDFLANRLGFSNMVTYNTPPKTTVS